MNEFNLEGSFDYIGEPLECLNCGYVELDLAKTKIQFHAAMNPTARYIKVGDPVEGYPDPYLSDYLHFTEKYDPSSFTLFENWYCDNCDKDQWVYCEIENGRFKSAVSVKLTAEILRKSDLVTELIQTAPELRRLRGSGINIFKMEANDIDKILQLITEHVQNSVHRPDGSTT